MSTTTIQSEISRIKTNVANSLTAVSEYGVDVAGSTSNDLAGKIRAIPTITLPVSIENGGTGATSALTARTNLMIKTGTEDPAGEDEPGTIYIKFA